MALFGRLGAACRQSVTRSLSQDQIAVPALYLSQRSVATGKKLYVGGLKSGTTDEHLRQAFEPHGEIISARIVIDHETGRGKGFGFVEFGTESEAEAAKTAMDSQVLLGRIIVVDYAAPPGSRPKRPIYAGYPRKDGSFGPGNIVQPGESPYNIIGGFGSSKT
eukprot:TRINITY_DN5161_c0_g1_i1.p1 TRINITY_DN5161_c0_g1~~TRINITY_DN5161_c0_g1_i1.p1  ORF type:complete len:179 (+),score=15.07 TRINITY_DN5161_c0_g1_i1:51-539(+)